MADFKFNVQKRTLFGSKTKRLRKEGIVPANIYGHKVKSLAVQMNKLDFIKMYKQAGENQVINITVEGEKSSRPVLASNIQRHPMTNELLHVDFRQVDLKEKIVSNVELEFVGESPAKTAGANILKITREVEVEALPNDLPEKIEVDMTKLTEIGQVLTAESLTLPKGVTLITAKDEALVKAEAARDQEEESSDEEAVAENTETTELEGDSAEKEEDKA